MLTPTFTLAIIIVSNGSVHFLFFLSPLNPLQVLNNPTAASQLITSTAHSILRVRQAAPNCQVGLCPTLARFMSYPIPSHLVFLSFPASDPNSTSLPVSVHQRRWNRQCRREWWGGQEEVCELRLGSGDLSRHDNVRLLPAAGHDQRHLQGRDVRLADVSTLHLLRVRGPARRELESRRPSGLK